MTLRSRALFLLLTIVSSAASIRAQEPFRLKDINPVTPVNRRSIPQGFAQLGSISVFVAMDAVHGGELWKTDGTAAGTVLLKDINPGAADSYNTFDWFRMTVSNGIAYFPALDAESGIELWKTDGTTDGTARVKDICPGTCSSQPLDLVDVNGTLYFSASEPATGRELWRSDGTADGTQFVSDIIPGSSSSDPGDLVNFNGALFFAAFDYAHGVELWRSSGGATAMFSDLDSTFTSSSPSYLSVANNRLFFAATRDGVTKTYVTDGVSQPVVLFDNPPVIFFGTALPAFLGVNSVTVFAANGANGVALYATDGTSQGTHWLRDLAPAPSAGYNIHGAAVLGNYLYFPGSDATAQGIWKTDGAAVSLLMPCTGAVFEVYGFTTAGSSLYFSGCGGASPSQQKLFVSDGTPDGTMNIEGLELSGGTIAPFNSGILFAGPLEKLWMSEGTAATTHLVADINPDVSSADTGAFVGDGTGNAAFIAYSGVNSPMWISNGTTGGTQPLEAASGETYWCQEEDFWPEGDPVFIDGTYYFRAWTTPNGLELWKTDSTSAGTTLIKDIDPGPYPFNAALNSALANVSGTLYFTANDGIHGNELWKSNGTETGTTMVADIAPGAAAAFPTFQHPLLTPLGTTVYVVANDGGGNALWKSDGAAGGTVRVPAVASASDTGSLAVVNGHLFFRVNHQLWVTDGFNTTQLTTTLPALGRIVDYGGAAVFRSETTTGTEIWKSDGTSFGTSLIAKVSRPPASPFDYPSPTPIGSELIPFAGYVFFDANDGVAGLELWKADLSNVAPVKDICPGICSSKAMNFTVTGDRLFFQANDGATGEELWVTDGTSANTTRTSDLEPGSGGSSPRNLAASANLLYFTATTLAEGDEAYVACTAATTHFLVTSDGVAISGASFPVSVTPLDASAHQVPCYTGSVSLTTDDANATLPAPFAFVAGEGPHALQLVLRSVGTHTITATDTVTNSIVGSTTVTVYALPAPVINASYDAANSRVVITFNNTAGAEKIEVLRSNNNQTWSVVGTAAIDADAMYDMNPAPDTTWLYVAHFLDASDDAGLDSNIDPATTSTFDDDPLTDNIGIKLLHLTQARAGIDRFRATVGLPAATYTNPTVATNDPLRAIDWEEMRARLDQARGLVARLTAVPDYTDSIAAGTLIKRAHLTDLWIRIE